LKFVVLCGVRLSGCSKGRGVPKVPYLTYYFAVVVAVYLTVALRVDVELVVEETQEMIIHGLDRLRQAQEM
jgi:hypothetical protein